MTNHRNNRTQVLNEKDKLDWRYVVEQYIADNPRARATDIARATGCTEAYALIALSDKVWEIPEENLPEVLDEVRTWETAMILVRNGEAIAEVEVRSDIWHINGDWLNWIETDYNLHIRIAATAYILALVRAGKHGPTYSFNLVNQAGQVFCRFYARTQAAKESLSAFCETYSQPF